MASPFPLSQPQLQGKKKNSEKFEVEMFEHERSIMKIIKTRFLIDLLPTLVTGTKKQNEYEHVGAMKMNKLYCNSIL